MRAFAGAEGLINSRALTYQSADARDVLPINPNHLLLASLLVNLPQKWKRGSTMVLREDGGVFNSWYNTSQNVGC